MKATREIVKSIPSIKVSEINQFANPDIVMQIAGLYQRIFKFPPWNEGYLCSICKNTTGNEEGAVYCDNCSQKNGWLIPMVEYWPIDRILTDFYQEMLKPGAVCLVVKKEAGIIAFAWGYKVELDFSLDEYLEAPGLHKLIKGRFLYLDECAVAPEWQGNGCGKALVTSFLRRAKKTNSNVLLRTMKGGVMHRIITSFSGEIVQEISRERIIMKIVMY